MSTPTLSFDGSDNYVDGLITGDFGTGPFTLSAWVNFSSLSSRNTVIDTGPVCLNTSTGDSYRIICGSSEARGGTPETGAWHHLAGRRDSNGRFSVVVDGSEVAVGSNTDDVSNSENIWMGRRHGFGNYLSGELDDVRVFGEHLSNSVIETVMDGGINGSGIAHWPLNEGSGIVISDATPNNNIGSIDGATWNSRTDGNTYSWSNISGWEEQSEDDTILYSNNIQIGQSPTHLIDSSDEARYIMDGNTSELQLYDYSGNENHTTIVEGIGVITENNTRFFKSYSFDGTGSNVQLPSNIQSGGTTIATELWFYPRSTGRQLLVDFQDFYQINFDRNGNQGINVGVYGENVTLGGTNLSTDQYHHVNMYWEIGSEVGVSVNGSTWDTQSITDGADNKTKTHQIGRNVNNTGHFDGKLTDLRFLTGQQIPIEDSLYQTDASLLTGRKP